MIDDNRSQTKSCRNWDRANDLGGKGRAMVGENRMRSRIKKTVKISFRILDLSEAQVTAMQTQVSGAGYGFRTYRLRREPKVIGAQFTLRQKQRYDDLVRFLKVNKIKKSSYGIWISLITNDDTGGMHVPDYVVKLYEKTGGNLDFTFTCG
jgi:hypothetical protein